MWGGVIINGNCWEKMGKNGKDPPTIRHLRVPLIVRFRKVNTKSANKSFFPHKFGNLASNLLIIQHILLKMSEIVLGNPFISINQSSTTTFPGYGKHNG